jgi:carbon storage regulator
MLVFTRQAGDEVVIGDGIRVRVLSISGTTVRLGVAAPREVPVHRAEVYEQIVAQNLAAAYSAATAEVLNLPGSLPGTRSDSLSDLTVKPAAPLADIKPRFGHAIRHRVRKGAVPQLEVVITRDVAASG